MKLDQLVGAGRWKKKLGLGPFQTGVQDQLFKTLNKLL